MIGPVSSFGMTLSPSRRSSYLDVGLLVLKKVQELEIIVPRTTATVTVNTKRKLFVMMLEANVFIRRDRCGVVVYRLVIHRFPDTADREWPWQ